MFRERERFTKRRLRVMEADGIDLKPTFDKPAYRTQDTRRLP
jgi:hypothetical protein